MSSKYEIKVYERKSGINVDNPETRFLRYGQYHGLFGFLADDIFNSSLLLDAKAFDFRIHDIYSIDPIYDWTNIIRAILLNRLIYKNWNWYLSFYAYIPDEPVSSEYILINDAIKNKKILPSATDYFELEDITWGTQFVSRLFFEVPKDQLSELIKQFWSQEQIGSPILGLLLPPGKVEWIKQWSLMKNDYVLFNDILNRAYLYFYTWPSENHAFTFITKKMNYKTFISKIGLRELNRLKEKLISDLPKYSSGYDGG